MRSGDRSRVPRSPAPPPLRVSGPERILMQRKFVVGAMALALTASGAGAAVAARRTEPPPTHATVNAVQKVQFKINRYVKDGLRWEKDVYQVKSGGTLTIVNKANDGPHTFSVVAKKDLPKTVKQINECTICEKIGEAHGIADPNSDAPPKFTAPRRTASAQDATRRTSTSRVTPCSSARPDGRQGRPSRSRRRRARSSTSCASSTRGCRRRSSSAEAVREVRRYHEGPGDSPGPSRCRGGPRGRARASTTGSRPCRRPGTSCPTGATRS